MAKLVRMQLRSVNIFVEQNITHRHPAPLEERAEAGAHLLDSLDAISYTVCAVVDTAELCEMRTR